MGTNGRESLDLIEEIKTALDEYREVQQEKRLYIQASFAVLTLVVVGSVGILSAMVNVKTDALRLGLALAAQFGQLALLLVAQILSAYSIRHGMYAAVIEERIGRLAGKRLLRWEITSAGEGYPGKVRRHRERSETPIALRVRVKSIWQKRTQLRSLWPPGAIDQYLLLLGLLASVLLAGEVLGTTVLIYHLVDESLRRALTMGLYVVIMTLLMGRLVTSVAAQGKWSERVLDAFRREEMSDQG